MRTSLLKLSFTLRLCLFVLFALGQLVPAGLAFASQGDDFTIVICTMDGAKSVSYAELTGEPTPFQSQHDDAENVCHVCVIGACAFGAIQPPSASIKVAVLAHGDFGVVYRRKVTALYAAGPPLPSRAPPAPVLI